MRILDSIFIFLVPSLLFGAQESHRAFIGFNGGGDTFSNFSYFEKRVDGFSSLLRKKGFQINVLNAGGPSGEKINLIDGYFERDAEGDLIRSRNSIAGDTASLKNLTKTLVQVKMASPKFVVYDLDDHGSEDGISAWNGELVKNDYIHRINNLFPEDTIVRGINLHCFSGKRISPEKNPESVGDMLIAFPKNRCGFASADVDEFGTNIDGLPEFVSSDPSLKNLKDFYNRDHNYTSTPRLTSDYYEESILKLFCLPDNQPNVCATDSPNSSLSDLQKISCKSYFDGQQELKNATWRVLKGLKSYSEFEDRQSLQIEEFLRKKYPEKSKLEATYYRKKEAHLISLQDGRKSVLKIEQEEADARQFLEQRYYGIREKYGVVTGLNRLKKMLKKGDSDKFVDDPDYEEFFAYAQAQAKQIQTRSRVVISVSPRKNLFKPSGEDESSPDHLFSKIDNEDDLKKLDEAQRNRKKLRREFDSLRTELVTKILENQNDPALRDRLANIKSCEQLPLSGD